MKPSSIILLVENDKDSIYFLEQAFAKADIRNPVKIVRYGSEAILYLRGVGIYSDRRNYPLPALILLDLCNPDGSSMALLAWIRQQEVFDSVPIVVMSAGEVRQGSLERFSNVHLARRENSREVISIINKELMNEIVLGPPKSVLGRGAARPSA